MSQPADQFKKLVAHCKEYGFIYQSSEIYDGLAAVYDYGPLGVELLRNVKEQWWHSMVRMRDDVVGGTGEKNRKLRHLRELYPMIRIKLFYARDFKALMLKYGRLDAAASLIGVEGQPPPKKPPAASTRAEPTAG